jgi:hypothetical protein
MVSMGGGLDSTNLCCRQGGVKEVLDSYYTGCREKCGSYSVRVVGKVRGRVWLPGTVVKGIVRKVRLSGAERGEIVGRARGSDRLPGIMGNGRVRASEVGRVGGSDRLPGMIGKGSVIGSVVGWARGSDRLPGMMGKGSVTRVVGSMV